MELALALTLRTVPVVGIVVRQAREACWSRGEPASLMRVLPAVIVRLVRDADLVGDAIVARELL